MEQNKKYSIGDTVRFKTESGTYTGTIVCLYAVPNTFDLADIEEESNHQLFLGITTDDLEIVEQQEK